MLIRILSDQNTYVDDHIVSVVRERGNRVAIPIRKEDIDMDTLTTSNDIIIDTTPISIVTTDTHTVSGELMEYTDAYAVVRSQGTRHIVKGYRGIDTPLLITGVPVDEPMSDQVSLSYISTVISGHIVHRLYSDGQLVSDLVVVNNGLTDLPSTEIQVMTSQQASPGPRMAFTAMAANTSEGGDIGTIYQVPGIHDIPAGHRVTVPLIDTSVDIQPIYTVDAPSGRDNALYTMHWQSPIDMPSGKLLTYREDILVSRTQLPMIGEGQNVDVSILEVPTVYAVGTIGKGSNGAVTIRGTLHNKGDTDAYTILRYYVGDQAITGAPKEGGYAVFPYTIDAGTSIPYSHSFSVQQA